MTDKVEQCTQITSDKNFFIIDDNEQNPPYIVEKNGEFEIINNNEKQLSFVAIDSCIYDSQDDTRADCAIYDDKTFCFIELKHSKRTSWKRHRITAEKQLKNTINNFQSLDIIKNKRLEAYMCCTCTLGKEYTKIKKASNKNEIIRYFDKTLNTNLYCDNKKEFN